MRVTVMGLGLFGGGEGAARYLSERGDEVLVTDLRSEGELEGPLRRLKDLPVLCRLGGHEERDFDCDLLVVNPAVRPGNPWVGLARERGARVTQEIDIALELVRGECLAVTGTSGKSTTSTLLARMLRGSVLGGNIGGSLLDRADEVASAERVVVEISSFQLKRLSARDWFDVSVLLNVRPNHIDWHGSFDAYARAKARVVECTRAEGWAVLNADDPMVRSLASRSPAKVFAFGRGRPEFGDARGHLEGDDLVLEMGKEIRLDLSPFRPPGEHNRLNALAASCAALAAGAEVRDLQRALNEFAPLPHRLELVRRVRGVRFVNDSIATTPGRAAAGMRSCARPFVLICGGKDKGLDWTEFVEEAKLAEKVFAVGEAAEKLKGLLGGRAAVCAELGEAVIEAAKSSPGTTVLLSPGGSSYDMFANFERRGELFRKEVENIAVDNG